VEEEVERRAVPARERRASCAGLEVERVGRRMGDGAEGDFEGAVLEAKADGEDVGLNLERRERRRFEPSADHLHRNLLHPLQLLHHLDRSRWLEPERRGVAGLGINAGTDQGA